ncbi:MAG: hypothetical protein JW909_10835 [Planctomycetes bacterium]|nr:hypothetical protein [Planctomycetota bacterium]
MKYRPAAAFLSRPVLAFCLALIAAAGCDYRWTGAGPSADWSDAANWQYLDPRNGRWQPASQPPGANDNVFFSDVGASDCIVDSPVTVTSLSTSSGYTGIIDVASDLRAGGVDLAGGTFSVGAGVTLTIDNRGSFFSRPGSSVVFCGTGLLAGEWATVTAAAGGSFSMSLAGDVDVFAARFIGIDDSGLELASSFGSTVFFDNAIFLGSPTSSGQYLNVTGDAWDGFLFPGLGFEEVGPGPNTTGTVRIDIPGATSFVTMSRYASSTPAWSSGETTDVTPADDTVVWAPLAVRLGRASAWNVAGGISVEWEVVCSIGNAGFHVERASSPDGPWARLTPAMLPGGRPSRSTRLHRWLDTAPAVPPLFYRIVDVDLAGRQTAHPPFPLAAEPPPWQPAAPPVRPTAPLAAGPVGATPHLSPPLKIITSGEGVFEIDDVSSLGLSPGDPFSLFSGGLPQWATWSGSSLKFYAAPYCTRHTRENATFLLPLPPSPPPPAPDDDTDIFPAVTLETRIEEDDWYYPFYAVISCPSGEAPWYSGDVLSPGAPWTRSMDAGEVSTAPAELRFRLVGFTADPGVRPDHVVKFFVNDVEVGTAEWDGWNACTGSLHVEPGVLLSGVNVVRMEAVDPGCWNEILVDRLDFRYSSPIRASGDFLAFDLDPLSSGRVTVAGFSGEDVAAFQVSAGSSRPLEVSLRDDGGTFAASVSVASLPGPSRLVMAGPAALAAPLRVEPAFAGDLASAGEDASYVVVAPKAFRDAALALAAHRAASGINVLAADFEDVCDEFNFGRSGPEGIFGLLSRIRPRYLLLLGDATSDPLDFSASGERDFVPSCFVHDSCSELLSDDPYSRPDGPSSYGIAVGRLPARSAAEASSLAAKVLQGELDRRPDAPAVFVADDDNVSYAETCEAIRTALPLPAVTAYMGPGLGAPAARNILHGAAAAGARCVFYMGHGGADRWASEALLHTSDAASFAPGHPTAVVALSCFNASFDGTAAESLGEALMRSPHSGAWNVIGCGGFADSGTQSLFGGELARGVASGLAWGDAMLAAKHAMPASALSVLQSFNLMGDPAAGASAEQASVRLISPNGGETIRGGADFRVVWASSGPRRREVDLEFSADGGMSWTPVAADVPDAGRMDWSVPEIRSSLCLLRISSTDEGVSDTTDAAFAVEPESSVFFRGAGAAGCSAGGVNSGPEAGVFIPMAVFALSVFLLRRRSRGDACRTS